VTPGANLDARQTGYRRNLGRRGITPADELPRPPRPAAGDRRHGDCKVTELAGMRYKEGVQAERLDALATEPPAGCAED